MVRSWRRQYGVGRENLLRRTVLKVLAEVLDGALFLNRCSSENYRTVLRKCIASLGSWRAWRVRPFGTMSAFKVSALGFQNVIRF